MFEKIREKLNTFNASLKPGEKRVMFLSFLLAVVTALSSVTAVTVAWIAENRKVQDTGLSFHIDTEILEGFVSSNSQYVALTGEEQILQTDLSNTYFMPGTEIEFDIGMVNKSTKPISINTIGIDAPTVWTTSSGTDYNKNSDAYDEVPVEVTDTNDNKTYAYFGKQMSVAVIQYTVYQKSTQGTDQIVVSEGATTEITDPVYYPLLSSEGTTTSLTLLEGLNINLAENGWVVVIRLSLKFEKEDYDQSDFVGFGGTNGGRCSRNIFVTFNEEETTTDS